MELIKKIKSFSAFSHLVDKYFAPATTIGPNVGNFTFPPSANLVHELTDSFTLARVDAFDNGPSFSAYHVDYNIGGWHGEAIYKTTTTMYPDFCMYETVEEYKMSFE